MSIKIFFFWQSDIEGKFNRNFIKDCLERAIKKINQTHSISEPVRLDHDTKGVTGSPDIANTILKKIDECDIFIGDVTFVSSSAAGRFFPNPNVLIELGYALKSLGDERVVCLMNTSHGLPKDNLPFDLSHKRWPIQYELNSDNYTNKVSVRDNLVAALCGALIPFTEKPRSSVPNFESNAEKIRHREKLREEFEKELLEIKARELRSDIIIRDIDRADGYPDGDQEEKGISSWFRIGLVGTYTKGIKVGLSIGTLTKDERGFRYTDYKNGETGDIKVYRIAEIPFDSIVVVNWEGDECYYFPHIYCHFNHDGEPYERVFYAEKVDMGNGHDYYKEVATDEEVVKNSEGLSAKYFA